MMNGLVETFCECGWKTVARSGTVVKCFQCKATVTCGQASPIKATQLDKWPTWAILVKCCRDKEDIGVGDTVKRMAATIGGERFKRWAEQCGIPCGCVERQETWNKRYPYQEA